MTIPFSSVYARIDAKGYRHILWSMDPAYDYPEDCVLRIQYSRAGGDTADWVTICDDVQDACLFIDYERRNYNKKINDYYRLVLHCPSLDLTYVSQPVHAHGYLPATDNAELNNLIRLTDLLICKTGRAGILLKKKVWGLRCPVCTHFEGLSSVNEHCSVCLGTGIKGGYYKGIPMGILLMQSQNMLLIGPLGYQQSLVIAAKCVAWPWIHLGDVWVDNITNQRYYIKQASVLSKHRHVPIVYQLLLHLLLLTDVLHSDAADLLLIGLSTLFIQDNKIWLKDLF